MIKPLSALALLSLVGVHPVYAQGRGSVLDGPGPEAYAEEVRQQCEARNDTRVMLDCAAMAAAYPALSDSLLEDAHHQELESVRQACNANPNQTFVNWGGVTCATYEARASEYLQNVKAAGLETSSFLLGIGGGIRFRKEDGIREWHMAQCEQGTFQNSVSSCGCFVDEVTQRWMSATVWPGSRDQVGWRTQAMLACLPH